MSKGAHVAVIGGGMAGLAAACRLAERGIKVTVFEAAPQLGGRARRVEYNGVKLDNGQHILLGAYRETLNLLKLAGVQENQVLLRLPLSLSMLNVNSKNTFSLNTFASLPAPLHLLFGLLFAKGLSINSRFSAIKLMLWLKLKAFKLRLDEPLGDFLKRKNQPQALIQNLWEPLCLAALNTPVALASSQIFCNVLRDSFDKKKNDSDLLLPRVDLSELLAEPLAAYITAHDGEIKLGHTVQKIESDSHHTILTIKNENFTFSDVIIACAPHQLETLGLASHHFNYQPITTIYLQYAPHVKLPQAMTGLVGSLAQWVFDRGQLCGQHGLMAVVISAHTPFEISQEALAEKIIVELKNNFPQLGAPLWHKVITEKRATFSCTPALARPAAMLADHVFLAGDYAYADYPATIEGGVRSGINAANLIV